MSTGSSGIGVVIPCRDEEQNLARCLTSLRAQVPAIEEIIVVDNGSTDASPSIARQWAHRVVELPGGSIASLRNRGADLLDGVGYVAFVDADCEVSPGWAASALDGLREADMVGSRTFASADASWVAARWAAIERGRERPGAALWSQHLVLRRDAWERLGGFDESLRTGEDADLSLRLRAQGGRVAVVEDMVVTHHGFPRTLRHFLRREVWHTSSPGWFARMSRASRVTVLATAAWSVAGLGTVVGAALGRRRPAVAWASLSLLAVPALGRTAGGSSRHALEDGLLTTAWALVRAVRLLGSLVGRGSR